MKNQNKFISVRQNTFREWTLKVELKEGNDIENISPNEILHVNYFVKNDEHKQQQCEHTIERMVLNEFETGESKYYQER